MGPEQQAAAATLQAGVPLDVLKDLKDYAPGHDGHGYMVIMFPLDSVSPLAGVAAHQEPQSESGHLQAPATTENMFTRSASPLNTVHECGFTSSLAATAGAAHVHVRVFSSDHLAGLQQQAEAVVPADLGSA